MINFASYNYYLEDMERYNQVVNDLYLKLMDKFINIIHKRLPALRFEDIEDIYSETFIAVRQNLLDDKVSSDTNWKAYIIKIGLNMAINKVKQAQNFEKPVDRPAEDDIDADERFQTKISLLDIADDCESNEKKEIFEKRLAVMRREINYLPEPCETILKDFYYGGMSMTEIMEEIHYKSTDAVKARRYWCMQRFKERVLTAFKLLNLTD